MNKGFNAQKSLGDHRRCGCVDARRRRTDRFGAAESGRRRGSGRGGSQLLHDCGRGRQRRRGYWVSIVTEDWRWRMVTPAKGDYASIPITPEAKKLADAWDPAKDEAAGEQCKSYGAPAIMRVPGRLHITWQDPNTLKVERDAGEQVRLLHFGKWTLRRMRRPPGRATPSRRGRPHDRWEEEAESVSARLCPRRPDRNMAT